MLQKEVINKKADDAKSIIIVPSKTNKQDIEDGEETEITAQITMPHEGGWGWMVVLGSFWCLFILDGVSYTFGSVFTDMTQDLQISESLVALLNSLAVALYFMCGPIASALINRFGFRASVMTGSIICSLSLFFTYFCTNYACLCLFYGVFAGFGFCLINLTASLVVGFYFEKLRSLAIAVATNGSSIGIMIMFPVNSYIVNLAGWRVLTLLHSGLFALVFFLGMIFRPLLSLTVAKTTDDSTKTVTYLPSLSASMVRRPSTSTKPDIFLLTATERLFSAVSNANFPTVADIFQDDATTTQPGPSAVSVSKLTVTAQTPQSGLSYRQLKQVQSLKSRSSLAQQDNKRQTVDVNVPFDQPVVRKRKWWHHCCHWEEHVPQSRPLYKDDAFYAGKLEKLPIYQKSVMNIAPENRTGLEYQLAVSRAVRTTELRDRGVFTTAIRRILATMMDPSLLSICSFKILCFSGLIIYIGYLTPYVFLQERNLKAGLEPKHCSLIVSVIGFANAVGRPIIGALACKINPLGLLILSCIVPGVAVIVSNLYYDVYFQYVCWFVFGFFIANLASLRSLIIVDLYGLEKLTNATGLILLFQGVGSLMGTPVSSEIKRMFGFNIAFYMAGAVMILGSLLILIIQFVK